MRRSRPTLAAVVVAIGAVLLAACGSDDEPATTSAPVTTAPVTTAPDETLPPWVDSDPVAVGWASLSVGDCFNRIADSDASDLAVWRVDCAVPHRYEVYDVIGLDLERPADGSFPAAEIAQRAEEQCVERFEGFVGVRWTVSELDVEAWWPSEQSWARGDSSVICAVMELSGDLMTGSQRGAAR